MKAVVTVLGKDTVGILAKVSTFCAERNMNVVEVTQSVLQDMFAMVMLVELDRADVPSFEKLNSEFDAFRQSIGTKIHIKHEDIFNSMHKI